jgi:cytosine/adenosine deaminase-related metal-dependent hydrolase
MVLDQYTQNIIIRNSKELVKNAKINSENGYIATVSALSEINTPDNLAKKQIISPGFINLHSHLAYTHLDLKPKNLFAWLKDLMHKVQNESFDPMEASLAGARLALSTGTTFLIDNTSHLDASIKAFQETGLRGIIGLELFGSDPQQAKSILNKAIEELRLMTQSHKIQFALSPHSLYSVSSELLEEIQVFLATDSSASHILPLLLMHFAEDELEEKYFRGVDFERNQNTGDRALQKYHLTPDDMEGLLINEDKELELLYDFWESLGVLDLKKRYRKQAESSWDYFKKYVLSAESGAYPRSLKYLLTHAINLSEKEIQELANYPEISLVSCPRSNQFLKHNMAKIPLWEQSGGMNYGLGTDSKASNYDLDLRSELKLLVENAGSAGIGVQQQRHKDTVAERASSRLRRTNDRSVLKVHEDHEDHEDDENAGIGVQRQHHEYTAQRQYELLTSSAARAIGMDDKIGSLEDSKYADYVVFEVMDDNLDLDSVDPYALVLDGEKTRVKEVYVGGDLVHRC